MSESHQNTGNHWVVQVSVQNRVLGNHLSLEDTTSKTIMHRDNGKFLPDKGEHIKQRENYVDLVSRIIADNVNCLNFPH